MCTIPSIRATGEPHYRNDIVEQRIGRVGAGMSVDRRRQELAAMTYYPPGNRLIIPLSQSCLEMNAQAVEKVEGGGSGRRRAAALL